MQSQGIQRIQGLIPTGAMNKQGSAARLTPLGMQMQLQNIENCAEHLKEIEIFFYYLQLISLEQSKKKIQNAREVTQVRSCVGLITFREFFGEVEDLASVCIGAAEEEDDMDK
ncbi:uncharacterized protein MONOS_17125 [Monocercomonoides exilis]|uniref:uncharacterized protein n=1 Tax=Monocercomonoides exilis TaxID=2049356 RepID=UPI003559C75E|nr:hypothetical protein MONOS_17125 [Monocercomonoides exilis]